MNNLFKMIHTSPSCTLTYMQVNWDKPAYRAGTYSGTIASLATLELLHPQPLPSPCLEESWTTLQIPSPLPMRPQCPARDHTSSFSYPTRGEFVETIGA